MRQSHAGGEKLFVDYAGDTVPVVDRRTGEVRDAHLFVTVLGGSSLSCACATWTEQFADWAEAHNAALYQRALIMTHAPIDGVRWT